jgi:arylsulfatase
VEVTLKRESTSEQGVLVSKGDRFGGITFYIKDNHLKYVYNADGEIYYVAETTEELPLGEFTVGYQLDLPEFNHGTLRLFIDGTEVKQIEIPTLTWSQSFVTTLRANKYTSVYDKDYEVPFEYNGMIKEIVIDVKPTHIDLETEKKLGAAID